MPLAVPISLALGRFKQLPQRTSEVWQGGLVRLPMWIDNPANPEGVPYRPTGAVWVSLRTGHVNLQLPPEGSSASADLALSGLFELAAKSRVRFNIETKLSPEAPDETLAPEPFARALLAEVRKAGVERRTTIQSFDFRTLAVVQREAPGVGTAYLTSRKKGEAVPRMVHEAKGTIWSPSWRDLDAQAIAVAHGLGLQVIPWTVNEPADIARMLDMKVDGIISDYPDRVREALKARR